MANTPLYPSIIDSRTVSHNDNFHLNDFNLSLYIMIENAISIYKSSLIFVIQSTFKVIFCYSALFQIEDISIIIKIITTINVTKTL